MAVNFLNDNSLTTIFSHGDPGDLTRWPAVCKRWYQLLSKDEVKKRIWKVVAEKIHFPIDSGENDIRKRLYAFFSDRNQFVSELIRKSLQRSLEFSSDIPKELIQEFQKIQISPYSKIEDIKTFKEYLDARSTIFVWEKMAKEISQEVPGLKNCKTLEAMLEKTKEFSSWCTTHQVRLSEIWYLSLHGCMLTTLPREIEYLTKLECLDLSWNQISEVPEAIGKLTHLTELYLNNNQISEVPEAVRKLTQLTKLDLSNNPISKEAY